MTTDFSVKIDKSGNKVVEPVCNGGSGSVGGMTSIRK